MSCSDAVASRFAVCDGLSRLSYMWCPPNQLPPVVWSAGIPSLTTYSAGTRSSVGPTQSSVIAGDDAPSQQLPRMAWWRSLAGVDREATLGRA